MTFQAVPGGPDLTPTQALILAATPASLEAPQGPNNIGAAVWGVRNTRKYQNCSAPFARPAGKALNFLLRHGLVERAGDMAFWRRTRAGDRYI
jgi:hypothetical protein